MIFKLLLLLLGAAWVQGITTSSGSLNGLTAFQQATLSIPAGNSIFSAYFNINNLQYSNVLLVVSFSPITLNLTTQMLSSYVASSNPILAYMDINNAIGDSPQFINLYIPSSASTVYLGFYNFDLPEVSTSKTYNLTYQFSNNIKLCQSCPPGSSFGAGLSCQCTPCSSNAFGNTCQYSVNILSGSSSFTLSSNKNKFLLISNPGSSVQITAQEQTTTGAVSMYVQYQYASGILAGKLNFDSSGNQTAQVTLTSAPTTLTMPFKGLNLLLTFHNFASSTASIAVSIPSAQVANISQLAIALGVVLSALGLIVVICVVCRVRKCLTNHSAVINASPALLVDSNSLTDEQINKYFPEVSAAVILRTDISSCSSEINLTALDGSMNRMERREGETLLQCSICFDEVRVPDQVRVTYCRHIFHGKCLLEWFHKNQICPNCRQAYDYSTTKRLRNAFKRTTKNDPKALVKAILGENFLAELQRKTKPAKQELQFEKLCLGKELEEQREKEERGREGEEMQEEATENQMQVSL